NASNDNDTMEHITSMINRVYAAAEKGLWRDSEIRTTIDDLRTFTENGQIAVARTNGNIIGCIRIHGLARDKGGFGLLAVDERYQGNGIGKKLIQFAEKQCQQAHFTDMQIELLVPQQGTRPDKERMKEWYKRLGYNPVRAENIEDLFPAVGEMLATPCKFIVFHKKL